MVRAAIKQKEIDERIELSDEDILDIIAKQLKEKEWPLKISRRVKEKIWSN